MARFAQYAELGGPEVIHIVERETPTPGPDRVLVEIRAAGVNPFDTKVRSGTRTSEPLAAPRGVGYDGAGVITAVGDDVTGWSVGDEVIVRGTQGATATHVLARPGNLTRKLPGISWEIAAALPVPVGTAYQAITSLGVGPGDSVLIHGGAGAVGQAAIQFARRAGAASILATGSARSADRLRELGAVPIAYGQGLLDRLRSAAPDGFTVILDLAGTDEAFDSITLLEDHHRFATIVAGAKADALGLTAYSGGSAVPLTDEQQALRVEALDIVQPLILDGSFSVEIGAVMPLDEVVEAHRASEAHTIRGKIILVP